MYQNKQLSQSKFGGSTHRHRQPHQTTKDAFPRRPTGVPASLLSQNQHLTRLPRLTGLIEYVLCPSSHRTYVSQVIGVSRKCKYLCNMLNNATKQAQSMPFVLSHKAMMIWMCSCNLCLRNVKPNVLIFIVFSACRQILIFCFFGSHLAPTKCLLIFQGSPQNNRNTLSMSVMNL